jgi:hypothetical protein
VSRSQLSVVFAGEPRAALLQDALPGNVVCVRSAADVRTAIWRRRAIVFADVDRLGQLAGLEAPVVGVLDGKPPGALHATVQLLDDFPWLSHIVLASLLETPRGPAHLAMLLDRFAVGPEQDMLVGDGVGRVALLAGASRREARFERMREFFSRHGVSERTIGALLEVAEELVMNALYDAPAEAGYFERPKERVEDVTLPTELACEISYGIEDGTAFVRLRDPFGALTRARLIQVLSRCSGGDVGLDASRGGAGLGLWRVFSVASTISITVVPGTLTEVLVGIAAKPARGARQVGAVHLFFAPKSEYYESFAIVPDDDHGLVDQSITLVLVA